MTQPVSLSAVYCDDVRHEVGGKVSLMGVYYTEMLFASFPAAAPKLCARIVLRFPFQGRPTESILIQVLKGEAVLGEMAIDREMLATAPLPSSDPDIPEEEKALSLQGIMIFSPFEVESPCRLRLRAILDGKEIKGNGLKIRLPTDAERAANGWPLPQ